MNLAASERYPSLYATPQLVGRQNILAPCERILTSSSSQPKLVFLNGMGGIGKTRILRTILDKARTSADTRVAEDVLDFYDILLHTPIELSNAIFETLTPPFDCFHVYQSTAQILNRARLSGNAVELDKLRQDTLDKFEQDLLQLSKSKRVILALDTIERVVYGLPGESQEMPLAEAWTWLMERLPNWQNVILFVAGREGAASAFDQIKAQHPAIFEEIVVEAFSLEESLKYFEEVVELVRQKGDHHLAERLDKMPLEFKRGAHIYSQGRPILLSLLVDYLSFPSASNLPEMLRRAPPDRPSDQDTHEYESALFDRLREGELGETLIALGRAPKGCDEELFSKLIVRKNEHGEEQPISLDEARRRLRDVQRLSIIKIRRKEHEQRFFLHDEMYDLLQRHVYSGYVDARNQQQAFESIKNYYHAQRDKSIQHLTVLYAPVEEEGRIDLDLQALNKAHASHLALQTEILFYHLRQDLGRGFRTYCRYAQEAILSRDVLMDLQLQAEILSFLSSPPHQLHEESISVDMILASLKIRPFARAWAQGKFEEAIQESQVVMASIQKEWRERFPGLLAALHTWVASLLVLKGQRVSIEEAQSHLAAAYSLIPDVKMIAPFPSLAQIDTILWYEKSISAFAHRVNGYLRRVQGFMKEAESEYQKAGTLLREIDLRAEMSAVKNDMGFAQAELGKYHDGRANVLHALELRKELGRRVPVALGLNTLAEVDVREGRYREARQNSERALSIFRAFAQRPGIAMALTTLAEATRRVAGTDPSLGVEARIELLRRARDYAREAQSLFTAGEPTRLVEALIEIGCACRDWVLQLNKAASRPGDDRERIFKESRDTFLHAAKLAKENGLTYRHVDALVNLVWLEFYHLESEDGGVDHSAIMSRFADIEKSFPPDDELESQPQVWSQKGKLYVLKGHLSRRSLSECRKAEPKGLSPTVESLLRDIGENYALGLEYNSRFSTDYRGLRLAKDSVSDMLKDLNSAEMRVLGKHVRKLYPSGSALQTLLTNRALWQGD